MIGKLDNVIHKINTERLFIVSVFDLDKGMYLYKYYGAPRLLNEFGSGENFFEHLNEKGHTNLNIASYMKNGSGKLRDAEPINVNFEELPNSDEPTTNELSQTNLSTTMTTLPITPTPPQDVASLFGLGAPQVFDLMIKKNDAERLTLEVSELKSENRVLKQENEKFREELLKDKYDYQKEKDKKGDTHALIGQITSSLPSIMEYMKPSDKASGLNAPHKTDFGSELKNNFVASIDQIDDATLKVLIDVANTCIADEHFTQEFTTLLKKFKLCQ